jgi:hypothetical protein
MFANNRDNTQHIYKVGSVILRRSAHRDQRSLAHISAFPSRMAKWGDASARRARQSHGPWAASTVGGIVHMSGSVLTIRDCSRPSVLSPSERLITCGPQYGFGRSLLAEDDVPMTHWKPRSLSNRFSTVRVWSPPSCEGTIEGVCVFVAQLESHLVDLYSRLGEVFSH